MTLKSQIQLQIEQQRDLCNLKQFVGSILEQYNVTDAVFAIVEGRCREVTNGYLVPEKEFTSLDECFKNMGTNKAVRVYENNKFTVGTLYTNLYECSECEHVFDITYLTEVR